MSLERGVCTCAELQVFSCYRGWKEACQATRAFSTTSRRELSSSFFFLQDKAPKEIHAILIQILGEHAPSYATVKNCVTKFKRGDFFTCVAPRPGRTKRVTTPEIVDQIHELFLKDRRISSKSTAEQLGFWNEWVGFIIHEDLDMRKLSEKWVPKCLNANQKRQRCQSEQIWNFFVAIQKISCRDWWPWTKRGYITMTRRHSNNQWSGGIAAHPTPKNSEYKNLLEKFSPRFFGIKTASSSLIIFQRAELSTRNITYLCWCNWRIFWRKNTAGRGYQGGLLFARHCPGSPGTCNPEETDLPGLPVLITHPILRIWPRRTTICSMDWQNNWKVAIFRPTRRSLQPRRPGWTDKFWIFLKLVTEVRTTG